MSAITPRQEAAFSNYKDAVEAYWLVKQRVVTNNEESKARWQAIQHHRDLLDNAEDELFASIVDDMPERP